MKMQRFSKFLPEIIRPDCVTKIFCYRSYAHVTRDSISAATCLGRIKMTKQQPKIAKN